MERDFNDKSCGLAPTIEELSQDYEMPPLVSLYKQKEQDITLARCELSFNLLHLEDKLCSIRFSHLENFSLPTREGLYNGFKMVTDGGHDC
jgi:hypothetical protein